MKRILVIGLSFMMIITSLFNVSAATINDGFPPLPSSSYEYVTILYDNGMNSTNDAFYKLWFTDKPFVYDGNYIVIDNTNYDLYRCNVNNLTDWSFWQSGTSSLQQGSDNGDYWTNYDILKLDGSIYHENDSKNVECDGSSCPATDLNHDNICDDCGQILTMSLRSTLLDYAHSVIDNALTIFDGAEYWLVTIGHPASVYNIYVSPSPFTYDKNTKALTSNGVVQRTTVTTNTDGSFKGGTSWAAKQPYTVLDNGKAVDSSHDIENFFPIPLWEEIQTLTQGETELAVVETQETIMILALLGVGLIVLLTALPLLLRSFKTFLN